MPKRERPRSEPLTFDQKAMLVIMAFWAVFLPGAFLYWLIRTLS